MSAPTFNVVTDPASLATAFRRVRANHGAPGRDNVTVEAFGLHLTRNLERLSEELASGFYRPTRLKRVRVPKQSGGFRELHIPAVRDRVVQTSMLHQLAPELDLKMHAHSFAYRTGRGIADAAAKLDEWGCSTRWVVDIDIRRCFDSISHARLACDLTFWIADLRLLDLALLWLTGFPRKGRGVAQGSPISPLFCNVFLHPIDCQLAAAGWQAVRYADDILLVAETGRSAKRAATFLSSLLRKRGLEPNSEKSLIVPPGGSFSYLGKRYGDIRATTAAEAVVQGCTPAHAGKDV